MASLGLKLSILFLWFMTNFFLCCGLIPGMAGGIMNFVVLALIWINCDDENDEVHP